MTKTTIILIFVILNLMTANCQSNSIKTLKGTYAALWGETIWSYEFGLDNTYTYQTSGHFGNLNIKGNYRIIKDTIILIALPKKLQEKSDAYFESDTLIIDGPKCLLDLATGHEHTLLAPNQITIHASKKRNLSLPGRPIIGYD